MVSKPILCLDFDGVIHSYTSGWKGADVIPDPPVPGALQFMAEATKHFTVAIFSSRSNQLGGIEAMRRWLWHYVGDLDWFVEIEWPTHKPSAFVGIDDRVLTFTGTWPTMSELHTFKPWNKRHAQSHTQTSMGAGDPHRPAVEGRGVLQPLQDTPEAG